MSADNLSNYSAPPEDDRFTNTLLIIQGSIYIPIFCAGIANNLLTILIFSLNRDMRTVTNCYLLNLAISDTLPLIVSLPFEISFLPIEVPWGHLGCQFRSLLAETSTNASILTISAFTIERYLAVCRPFHNSSMLTIQRAIKIQVIIWFLGILSSTPYFYITKKIENQCSFDPNFQSLEVICCHISAIFFFVLPAFILCVLYALMARRLYTVGLLFDGDGSNHEAMTEGTAPISLHEIALSQQRFRQQQLRAVRHVLPATSMVSRQSLLGTDRRVSLALSLHVQSMKKSAFKMLFAVVIAFIICYAPFHAQRLLTSRLDVSNLSLTQRRAITVFYFISGIFYYIGSTVNPIFYHLFSRKYRSACIRTMKRIVHCERHYPNPPAPRKHHSLPTIHYPRLPRGSLKPLENVHRVANHRKASLDIGINNRHLVRLSLPPLTLKRIR